MVNAKLNVICGNCGDSEMLEYKHGEIDPDCGDGTCIICNNCATIHSLQEWQERLDEKRDVLRRLRIANERIKELENLTTKKE